MKIKKKIVCGLAVIFSLSAFTGCSHPYAPQAANELHFPLDHISEIMISYDEEAVTFYEAEGSVLVIKEYMTAHKDSYYAKVQQDNNRIHISEGGKPFFKDGFTRYIEVYLPASYTKNLTVTTTNGDIDLSSMNVELSALRIDSTKGNVQLGKASASNIYLSSTSGNIVCGEIAGIIDYTSTSGNLHVKSASGSGRYQATNSGKLEVTYTEVTGDLSFYNKNGGINLIIPPNLEFNFEAAAKNGSISTSFQENIKTDGGTASGTVGGNPTVTIKAETNNGNIQVSQ